MYTSLKNVQVIISLLKQYGIRHLVLSPGNRNAPFVHSVETDPWFSCYSIVDERSAAYFALGLAEKTRTPVGFCCTSSTASCNYMPAIAEAAEKGLPLIAITADRNWFKLFQMEDQMIDQVGMFGDCVEFTANLPEIRNSDDLWFCERTVNEALTRSFHAPVQINFQVNFTGEFCVEELPKYRKIDIVPGSRLASEGDTLAQILNSKKRILVLCGQQYPRDPELVDLLEQFHGKYNCAIVGDCYTNLCSAAMLNSNMVTESMSPKEFAKFKPDLVLSLGHHVWSFVKYRLREKGGQFDHWRVDPDGEMIDGLRSLTRTFACGPKEFLRALVGLGAGSDGEYDGLWRRRVRAARLPELGFSNFGAIASLVSKLPAGSMVHSTILNATRLASFANPDPSILFFSNLGADGIDGGLSTFLGESHARRQGLSFLISGDLSFLYDANALFRGVKPSQRLFVVNNFAGSEFHTNYGLKVIPTLNRHVAAGHGSSMEELARVAGAKYLKADSTAELESALAEFTGPSEVGIVLEVFTNPEFDAKVLKSFYALNQPVEARSLARTYLGPWKKKATRILTKLRRR